MGSIKILTNGDPLMIGSIKRLASLAIRVNSDNTLLSSLYSACWKNIRLVLEAGAEKNYENGEERQQTS